MNMYAYVGNDPINRIDPTGLQAYEYEFLARYTGCRSGASYSICDQDGIERYLRTAQQAYAASAAAGAAGGGGGGGGAAAAEEACPVVPPSPPGEDINVNIAAAEAQARAARANRSYMPYGYSEASTTAKWFYGQVDYGRPWDYKRQNPEGTFLYNDFGNFNYGATGRAAGFSAPELLWAAGLAQLKSDLSRGLAPQSVFRRFDRVEDPGKIEEGIKYHDNGCNKGG